MPKSSVIHWLKISSSLLERQYKIYHHQKREESNFSYTAFFSMNEDNQKVKMAVSV